MTFKKYCINTIPVFCIFVCGAIAQLITLEYPFIYGIIFWIFMYLLSLWIYLEFNNDYGGIK